METGEMEDGFWFEEAGVPYGQKSNVLLKKSFAFSVRIVNLYKWLHKHHKDRLPVARQILRSGTAIGANAEEANGAYYRKEFAAKLQISLKAAKQNRQD